jgi:hypothetical protein
MAGAIKDGVRSRSPGRFDKLTQTLEHDGWYDEEPPNKHETIVLPEPARSVIPRNKSPDIGFNQSINPYRGCEHGCVYGMSGDTPILMSDGTTRVLAELSVGDEIYGTKRVGTYIRYTKTRVHAHWSVIKPVYRITLEDGTTLDSGPDHRFLTDRGWKFVTGTESGRTRRPHLTVNNKLMGVGGFATGPAKGADYRRGYLCGVIRGDGHLGSYHYVRVGRTNGDQHRFRLALCDDEALIRTEEYLRHWRIETKRFVFAKAAGDRRHVNAIRTSAQASVEAVRKLIAWPSDPGREWQRDFWPEFLTLKAAITTA